jgi:isoleucyl-tRNA synthetase
MSHHKIYFISGVSGVGKTSTLEQLKKILPQSAFDVRDFDERGVPEFGLERELDWLSHMSDWLISKKNRYWGLALPIYECKACGNFEILSGRQELKEKAVKGWSEFEGHSPHKPYIDEVKIACTKCGKEISRIEDVGNVWLDAGIVPFSTYIDPKTKKLSYTSDKLYWKEWYPIDFITESFPGQFKNWFYSMIAMSTVLEKKNPFKRVLGYASALGEDGRPMHKSWGNSIEFNEAADKIGVDVMRWMYVSQNPEQNLLFGYKKADETRRSFHLLLWNVYNFFITYATIDKWDKKNIVQPKSKNVLDQWILARLNHVIDETTKALDLYHPSQAAISLGEFVQDLSTWYIRRSRDRVGPTVDNSSDKENFYETCFFVLITLSKLLAPFTPFIAEEIYVNLTGEESVHLSEWPVVIDTKDKMLCEQMSQAREVATYGHAKRKMDGIKVRTPILKLMFDSPNDYDSIIPEIREVILSELNAKNIVISQKQWFPKNEVTISANDLEAEGAARELVRSIQIKRKEAGCRIDEKIKVTVPQIPKKFEEWIKKETLSTSLTLGDQLIVTKLSD